MDNSICNQKSEMFSFNLQSAICNSISIPFAYRPNRAVVHRQNSGADSPRKVRIAAPTAGRQTRQHEA
jgi:hypothetical protein